MKGIYFLAIGIFGVLLLLFGCAQATPQYVCPDGKTIVAAVSACPGAGAAGTAGAEPAAAQTGCAITSEIEFEVCSGMPEVNRQSMEETCIMGLAAKHENASLCKKLSFDGRKNCYLTVAVAMNDMGICKEAGVGTDRDNCYQQYASMLQDASACDVITDINYKDGCYSNMANVLGEASLCDKIKASYQKDSCYYNMASRFQDSGYCNKISNEDQKQNCLNQLSSQYGYAKKVGG